MMSRHVLTHGITAIVVVEPTCVCRASPDPRADPAILQKQAE